MNFKGMKAPCRVVRYKEKRSSGPVVKRKAVRVSISCPVSPDDVQPHFYGEEAPEELPYVATVEQQKNTIELLREWVEKQRFIPQDLSDELLDLFLSAAEYNVDKAAEQMQKYFYSRQEPSPLFRDRDPLSPANVKILEKLYVLPMPDTTEDGTKIILTGLIQPTTKYNPIDHAKALAMVLDLLIWEKDFGFGDFAIVFDGRGFTCPQLLQKPHPSVSITRLLLDNTPGTLRSFYLLYPPPHVVHVADSRHGIWLNVVKTKLGMIGHLPADVLPLEFGGNLGHLSDLLEQWSIHLVESRDFFIHFERRMMNDYRRRLCHETELLEGGKSWVHRMKLEADEWEYKIKYYEKMKNFKPLTHPAFGTERLLNVKKPKPYKDPMAKCKKLAKEQKEKDLIFEPTFLYHGYAKEIMRARKEAEEKERREILEKLTALTPSFELEIRCVQN